MAIENFNAFAGILAAYAESQLSSLHRGALLVRSFADGKMFASLFGNDNYRADAKVQREVEIVRQHLKEARIEVVGFGLSPDGRSWALLVQLDCDAYESDAGKAFQIEMLKVRLEEIVWRSWQAVCVEPTGEEQEVEQEYLADY